MPISIRAPTWVSTRRLLEQKLTDLHKSTNLDQVKQAHAQFLKADLHQDPHVAPKLISAFSHCRQMALATNVFNLVQEPNVHLFNTLIRAYIQNFMHSQAFSLFFELLRRWISPDNFTYPFLLKACSGENWLPIVQMMHTHILIFGFCSDIFVPNALIDSYSKCGVMGLNAARKLFFSMAEKDVVSWNSMMSCLVKAGELVEALRLFDEMPVRDSISWNTILDGFSKAGDMNAALELFEKMPERNVISWSTMISGYSKLGDMEMARILFDKMPVKSLVSWTILISGYAGKGLVNEAIILYDQMEKEGRRIDDGAVISILSACAESGLLGLGRKVHSSIERMRFKHGTHVSNALVDMYLKCGSFDKAWSIFDRMEKKDIVSWNVMIQGLAIHGYGKQALELFSRMKEEGFKPDKVTFIGVLCGCTHAGLLDKGIDYFYAMKRDYGIAPQVEHYGCAVDLLGRGGRLNEAFRLIQSMPYEPNAIIWGTLLGACRMHNVVGLAEVALGRLVELEPSDPGNFSLLSNIYAAGDAWDNVADVRLHMKSTGIQKPSGASSIELDDGVHEFTVFDWSHPNSNRIYQMVERLSQHLKQLGYVPLEYEHRGIGSQQINA